MDISGFVVVSFLAVNTLRTLAYVPQIWAAVRHPESARGISILTWSYFAVAHLTGVAYSVVITHDANLVASFLGNFFACTLLVIVVAWQRRRGGARAPIASGARTVS
jgi:uncharacterized protein with PQ loop repeat